MNIRLYFRTTLNVKFIKENEELIKNDINIINNDRINVIFSNHKNFENLFGPSMIVSFSHMTDINYNNSMIYVDLEARFINFGEDDEVLTVIRKIILLFTKLARENKPTHNTFGDEIKIKYQINTFLGHVENREYLTKISQIDIEHTITENREKETLRFINSLYEYKKYFKNYTFKLNKK